MKSEIITSQILITNTLAQNPNIIINTADKKNLGISIDSTGWYVQECIRQLNDTRLY